MPPRTDYAIWLYSGEGARLANLGAQALEISYTRALNNLGAWEILLPGSFSPTLVAVGRKVIFWRKPENGRRSIDFAGLVRGYKYSTDRNGLTTLRLYGPGLNDLLRARHVAYTAGHAQAGRSATAADDIMKAIVRYNLGSSATTGNGRLRAGQFDSTYFQVAADTSQGPTLSKDYAYRNVLDVLRELSDAARTAGTEIYFDAVAVTEGLVEFRTYRGQPGMDRTSGANGIIFALDRDNLVAPSLDTDWRDEANVAYGLGPGDGASRTVQISVQTTRNATGVWAARECTIDARNETTAAATLDAADAMLVARRPVVTFEAELTSAPGSVYGTDWAWGDRVTVSYAGKQFAALVRAISVQIGGDGRELVRGYVEALL